MELDRSALIPVFLGESADNLAEFEMSLLRLEATPEDDELVASLFRCAHTLKGNAEALGFLALATCAHAVESTLDAVRRRVVSPSADLISSMLDAHDALCSMLAVVAAGETPTLDAYTTLIRRLSDVPRGAEPPSPGVSRAAAGSWETRAIQRRTLRVDLACLDRILTATGELSIAEARLHGLLEATPLTAAAAEAVGETARIFGELREEIMRIRLVPVGPMLRQQLRSVRDLAAAHGKLARLELVGQDVEVDTAVVEQLRDPIMHMVRNAVDHGLELPAMRREKGKDPVGKIRLSASHEAGRLLVEIADDGAGFDRARIVQRAKEIGALGVDAHPSDAEVDRLAFAPGLSTSRAVSDLSGRGVGMDVVARGVAAMKGSIAIRSTPGLGTTVSIRVPLTLAIVQGFAVTAAAETFVLPLDAVRECIDLPPAARRDARRVVDLRGEALPYLRLREVFALSGAEPPAESVVVLEHDGCRAGLAVDRLCGESQAVVKPLGRLFDGVEAVVGSTILADGSVALILDVASLLRGAVTKRGREPLTEPAS